MDCVPFARRPSVNCVPMSVSSELSRVAEALRSQGAALESGVAPPRPIGSPAAFRFPRGGFSEQAQVTEKEAQIGRPHQTVTYFIPGSVHSE